MASYKPPSKKCLKLARTGELNLLSDIIRYLAKRNDLRSRQAKLFLTYFEDHLHDSGLDNGSIVLQEHWVLFHDVHRNVSDAIHHRERLIELVERLFQLGGPMPPIDHRYLHDAMRTLRKQYKILGQVDKARSLAPRLAELKRAMNQAVKRPRR